jgi:hypothetical protein
MIKLLSFLSVDRQARAAPDASGKLGGRPDSWVTDQGTHESSRGMLLKRIGHLVIFYYACGGIGYLLIGEYVSATGNPVTLRLDLDDRIPFSSGFVWIYSLYYFLPLLMWILIPRLRYYPDVLLSFAILLTVSFVIFIVYPVRIIRPIDPGSDLSGRLVGFIYRVDSLVNAFPSLHVASSFLTSFIVWFHRRWLGAIFFVMSFGVAISTLYLKQHWLADVVAGALLAVAIYLFVYRWHPLSRLKSGSKEEC